MFLIDTHTHLYLDAFNDDREEMLDRAIADGVDAFLLPNIDSSTTQAMNDLVRLRPGVCFPMMGLHPCSVKDDFEKELDHVKTELDTGNYIAVGEIGIDLYWDKSTLDIQVEAFKRQIEWAKEMSLPIVIHTRDSFPEVFSVVDDLNDDRLTGVFHCFTGTKEQADHIISYGGFKMGIGGVVTFKNGGLDKVLPDIPVEYVILETDSPYLTPHPHRGKRNESAYVKLVAQKTADLYEIPLEKLAEISTENAKALFPRLGNV